MLVVGLALCDISHFRYIRAGLRVSPCNTYTARTYFLLHFDRFLEEFIVRVMIQVRRLHAWVLSLFYKLKLVELQFDLDAAFEDVDEI